MPVTESSNSTQRLLDQLQSANVVVESLGVWRDPVTQELHLQEDPIEVARRLASGLVHELELASAFVWFYDAADDALVMQAHAGLVSPALAQISHLVPDESPIGALVSSRTPKLSNHLKAEPWIQSPEWIEAEHLVGFAGYPITLGTDLIGCVAVFSHHTLEPEFLEVLQFICTHTSSAIATARQAHLLRQQAQQETLLREVGQKLRSAVGVSELLEKTVAAVGSAFDCDRVQVLLLPESPHEPLAIAPQWFSSENSDLNSLNVRDLSQWVSNYGPTPQSHTIACQDMLAIEDEHLTLRQRLVSAGYRVTVSVPVVLKEAGQEQLLAYLLLGWQEELPLEEGQLELLKTIASQVAVTLNKAKLLEQFQQQAERQALLYRMTDRIRYSLNLDEILQAAVTEVGEALQASRAQFLFGNSSLMSATYRYAFAQTGIDSWLNREVSLAGNALALKLFRPDEAIVIQEWSSLDDIEPRNRRALQRAGVQSLIVAGMNLGQDYYGILSVHRCRSDYSVVSTLQYEESSERTPTIDYSASKVDTTEGNKTAKTPGSIVYSHNTTQWSEADRKLLKAVAEQLTIAINQSRLYQKTQQQAKQEALLNEISADIRNSLDPTQVLESIEQSLAATLELKKCTIQLYDGTTTSPPSFPSEGPDIRPLTLYETLANGYPLQLEPEDLARMSEAELEFFQLPVNRACALIPLLQAGELMGTIIMIASRKERVFPHEKFLLAIAVAEQAGIALKQAQLYERVSRLAQREMLLRKLAQELTGTYEVEGIIRIALEGMADSLGVDRCDFITLSSQQAAQLAQLSSEDLQQQIEAKIQANIGSSTAETSVGKPAQFQLAQSFLRDTSPPDGASPDTINSARIARGNSADRDRELEEDPSLESGVSRSQMADGDVVSDLSWLLLMICYGQRESLQIEDVRKYPISPQARQNLLQAGISALVAVPVTIGEDVLGVLCTTLHVSPSSESKANLTSPRFSPAELELLEAIADMTAVAVQRTQFSEQARMRDALAAAMRGLTEGREAESKRLAADLHDQTIADLGAMSRKMRQLASLIPTDLASPSDSGEEVAQAGTTVEKRSEAQSGDTHTSGMTLKEQQREIANISQQLEDTIAELRCIVEDLQPTAMRAFNLGSALRSLLERAAQRSATTLLTRFEDRTNGELDRLEPLAQSTLFRIVQEALNNVVKHAGATRVDCSIRMNGDLLDVKVIDNGRGMPDNPTREGSHGLLNMRYRAELIGGEIRWCARKTGTGTIAQLLVPLPEHT